MPIELGPDILCCVSCRIKVKELDFDHESTVYDSLQLSSTLYRIRGLYEGQKATVMAIAI